jgi:hypothetical protein
MISTQARAPALHGCRENSLMRHGAGQDVGVLRSSFGFAQGRSDSVRMTGFGVDSVKTTVS